MPDSDPEKQTAQLEPELREMKIGEGGAAPGEGESARSLVKLEDNDGDDNDNDLGRTPTPSSIPPRSKSRTKSQSPNKPDASEPSSPGDSAHEEVVGGEITLKMEPGKAPKLSRTAPHKIVARPPPLYFDHPDVTNEAKDSFVVLPECTYANRSLGTTDHALECECSEEWDPIERVNHACGEDSDCINRATKMECVGDCSCGSKCQNQRFMRKQYADVTVIKTEKKGYGLRANRDMKPGDFVFEYIGEVIDERNFRKRMLQYDDEGIKHFYFMSLTKGEFVDATKKGNLGRFCNHSCNPNCFVDKWVVGDKLRMGIFAERKIKAGEELVFNYNVDRYGADPQPCYCGEPNCTGFIGGRTQTDNATKLSHATIEALGIDDGDGWHDAAPVKKPRKKKVSEDDEEYVNDLQPRTLQEDGVTKVMAALRQCSEKWIAVKLLDRIQQTDDEKVFNRVIKMHGYEILKSTLTAWMEDFNVVLQILDILHKLPRITRNKIQDSKIEEVIEKLKTCGDERVEDSATELLEAWSKLEMAYRIPRMKRDPNAGTPLRTENHFERREKGRERSKSRSRSPSIAAPKGPANIPSGPRGFNAQRGSGFFNGPRPPHRPRAQFNPLPPGWFQATSDNGSTYYYNSTGTTQWQRPTLPPSQPAAPPKAKTDTQLLQDIISSITQNVTPTIHTSAATTPQPVVDEVKEKKSKSEKWMSLSQEKQEKLYEATISPHVLSVAAHYRKKLDKDDVKRLCKEVAKKLVRGDYKSGRVKDPTAKISSKHEKTIKTFVKDYMDKAVKKKLEREQAKASKGGRSQDDASLAATETPETPRGEPKAGGHDSDDEMVVTASFEGLTSTQTSPADSPATDLKRKREGDGALGSPKKTRTEMSVEPPPPPPPPPPAEDMAMESAEATLTPMDDDMTLCSRGSVETASGVSIDGKSFYSPMQLATPPTNGVYENGRKDGGSGLEKANGSRHQVTVDGSS